MLRKRVMISVPTEHPEAFRRALKAVTSNHGTEIGLWVSSLILNSEYGEEFQKQFTKFFTESGYKSIQTDTISNKKGKKS